VGKVYPNGGSVSSSFTGYGGGGACLGGGVGAYCGGGDGCGCLKAASTSS
jgi:hypothetical protein